MSSRVAWVGLILSAVALVAYFLPWYAHDTAGFTMNGWDLAEWSSLHPAVRSSSPAMLTSLLLRLPYVATVLVWALAANWLDDKRWRWVVRGVALALALRMMPPSDFFSNASDDLNYRQLAFLSGVGLVCVGGAIAWGRSSRLGQVIAGIAVLVFGAFSGWMGVSRAGTLLDNFEISVSIGIGLVLHTAAVAIVCMLLVADEMHGRGRRTRRTTA